MNWLETVSLLSSQVSDLSFCWTFCVTAFVTRAPLENLIRCRRFLSDVASLIGFQNVRKLLLNLIGTNFLLDFFPQANQFMFP